MAYLESHLAYTLCFFYSFCNTATPATGRLLPRKLIMETIQQVPTSICATLVPLVDYRAVLSSDPLARRHTNRHTDRNLE